MTFEQKITEGLRVYDQIFKFGRKQLLELPQWDTNEDFPNMTRHAVAKSFIVSSMELTGQITHNINHRNLFIALLGLRTLLEFDINGRYIFNHPEHPKDFAWIDPLCADMYKTTNSLDTQKSHIGGVGLKKRAIEVGMLGVYEANYASLSDYAHHTLRNGTLNEQPRFETLSVDCIAHTLTHANNVLDSISNCYDLSFDDSVEKQVDAYMQHLNKENIIEKK